MLNPLQSEWNYVIENVKSFMHQQNIMEYQIISNNLVKEENWKIKTHSADKDFKEGKVVGSKRVDMCLKRSSNLLT